MAEAMKILLVFVFVSNAFCLDLQRLSDDCMKGRALGQTKDVDCLTRNEVKVVKLTESSQTFYCIYYEKRTGNLNEFDVLSFDLSSDDYDFKFTGANVISNDELSPKFKIYDTRKMRTYKGKFAMISENAQFDIRSIKINDNNQVCNGNGEQVWPKNENLNFQISSSSLPSFADYPQSANKVCGTIKKVESFGNHFALSSYPGQFPWVVGIHRYFNDGQDSYYKCGGTIIDKRIILTSANCLLEDGLLLDRSDFLVYAAPYALSEKMINNQKIYNVFELKLHEGFNFQLDNNIAVLKLTRDIEYTDYIQPICLQDFNYPDAGTIGKLAGFGKTTSLSQPRTGLLTEAEYVMDATDDKTFNGENTSGNNQISDIGAGLFQNVTNRWILTGIMSRKAKNQAGETLNGFFTFTNVAKYLFWIDSIKQSPQHASLKGTN